MSDGISREISLERLAQDHLWGGPAQDDRHTEAEWVALLARHLGLAVDDGSGVSAERFRKQLVRVAALAVAAVESWDRLRGKEVDQRHRGSGV